MTNSNKMPKKISLKQAFPIIEEKLREGGLVTFSPHGQSMLPLIREGMDSVTISALKCMAKIGDVVFYQRPSGQFVLHRIVGRDKDGLVLCGDNQLDRETGVRDDWVIGIMTSVRRNGKELSCKSCKYRVYVKLLLPAWKIWMRIRPVLSRVKRKIKKVGK